MASSGVLSRSVRFFCLSKKKAKRSPKTSVERASLITNGLGEARIIIGCRDSSDTVKIKIREAYPKLDGITFDLMVCDGPGGSINIPLKPFKGYHRIPRGAVFHTRTLNRISVIYIRPTENLLRVVREPIEDIPRDPEPLMHISQPSTFNPFAFSVNSPLDTTGQQSPTEFAALTPTPSPQLSYSSDMSQYYSYITPFQRPRPRPEVPPINQSPTPVSLSPVPFDVDEEGGSSGNATDEFEKVRREVEVFRQEQVVSNPGTQCIEINRENFLQNLLLVYDRVDLNMKRKLKVEFTGEAGLDYGGLSNEYFWMGLTEITDKSLDGSPLFEGAKDHLVPISNIKVCRRGDFVRVGKFIAHSIIHTGIGFVGFSPAVSEYLTMEKVTSTTHITIKIEDLPDFDHQQVLSKIQMLKEGEELTNVEKQEIRNLAQSSDYLVEITPENAEDAMYNIMRYQVIERRKQALDDIKYPLVETGILKFVQDNPQTKPGIFPAMELIHYPLSFFLQKIKINSEDKSFKANVNAYLEAMTPDKIPKLLRAWTGAPVIPINQFLFIESDHNVKSIFASTCTCVIKINGTFNAEQVSEAIEHLIKNETGFGFA